MKKIQEIRKQCLISNFNFVFKKDPSLNLNINQVKKNEKNFSNWNSNDLSIGSMSDYRSDDDDDDDDELNDSKKLTEEEIKQQPLMKKSKKVFKIFILFYKYSLKKKTLSQNKITTKLI